MSKQQQPKDPVAEAKALLQKETEKKMKECLAEIDQILNKYGFKFTINYTIQLAENEQGK